MACNRPWLTKDKIGRYVAVPCGWCRQCRIDRREEWTMRLHAEVSAHDGAFVTLTYNDEHCPQDYQLNKVDYRLYLKRLRQNLTRSRSSESKIKFYCVGEYGEIGSEHDYYNTGFGRPHYHLIISGVSPLFDADIITRSWSLGFVKVLPAIPSTIRYVLKYMDKQLVGRMAKDVYGDFQPPFCSMSNGIGRDFLVSQHDKIEYDGGIFYRGRLVPVPRYYKKLMGIESVPDNTNLKIRKVLSYMDEHNCTYEFALNQLGMVNEAELTSKDNLFHS